MKLICRTAAVTEDGRLIFHVKNRESRPSVHGFVRRVSRVNGVSHRVDQSERKSPQALSSAESPSVGTCGHRSGSDETNSAGIAGQTWQIKGIAAMFATRRLTNYWSLSVCHGLVGACFERRRRTLVDESINAPSPNVTNDVGSGTAFALTTPPTANSSNRTSPEKP